MCIWYFYIVFFFYLYHPMCSHKIIPLMLLCDITVPFGIIVLMPTWGDVRPRSPGLGSQLELSCITTAVPRPISCLLCCPVNCCTSTADLEYSSCVNYMKLYIEQQDFATIKVHFYAIKYNLQVNLEHSICYIYFFTLCEFKIMWTTVKVYTSSFNIKIKHFYPVQPLKQIFLWISDYMYLWY